MTHYHVTARTNLAPILAEGLRTDVGGWDTKFVWMFDDLAIAKQAADQGRWGSTAGNVILVVDVDGLDIQPDPHPGWGNRKPGWDEHAFAHAGPISASRVHELDLQLACETPTR